jgi:hypothetical protein
MLRRPDLVALGVVRTRAIVSSFNLATLTRFVLQPVPQTETLLQQPQFHCQAKGPGTYTITQIFMGDTSALAPEYLEIEPDKIKWFHCTTELNGLIVSWWPLVLVPTDFLWCFFSISGLERYLRCTQKKRKELMDDENLQTRKMGKVVSNIVTQYLRGVSDPLSSSGSPRR